MTRTRPAIRIAVALAALALVAVSVLRLEGYRAGLDREALMVGDTPATLYRAPGAEGPLVVVAHGFAGSRQLMEAFSLTLARAGYAALAFDFQGHGRNPVPMGGDVTSIDGTTARLMDELARVVAAGRATTGWEGPVALIGHSMASDVVIRAALADQGIGPVIAVSSFSEAVTATEPARLLIVNGEWEPGLRAEARRIVALTDPGAEEGETIMRGDTLRRAVYAPKVEHVGVLYSRTTLEETLRWLDDAYGRPGAADAPAAAEPTAARSGLAAPDPVAAIGGWLIGLLAGVVALVWALSPIVAEGPRPPAAPRKTVIFCLIVPPILTPLIATQVTIQALPVLVADYLALHLLIYGALQILILRRAGVSLGRPRLGAVAFLLILGIGGFGLALDRYGASFAPFGPRLLILAVVALGAAPFMMADAALKEAGRAPFIRRAALFVAFMGSLVLAAWLDGERLLFLLVVFPVIVLFFAVFGLMGRWVGLRAGPASTGLALGLIFAWSIAASFPLFEA